jgi:hypothetical protein
MGDAPTTAWPKIESNRLVQAVPKRFGFSRTPAIIAAYDAIQAVLGAKSGARMRGSPHPAFPSSCIWLAMRSAFSDDRGKATRPCIQRRPHLRQIFCVIVVFARDGSRSVVQDSLNNFVGDAHIAQVRCRSASKIMRVEWVLDAHFPKLVAAANHAFRCGVRV